MVTEANPPERAAIVCRSCWSELYAASGGGLEELTPERVLATHFSCDVCSIVHPLIGQQTYARRDDLRELGYEVGAVTQLWRRKVGALVPAR